MEQVDDFAWKKGQTYGTVLQYWEVVNGENVAGNPRWGRSPQEYYFWMGGTDHPNA